MVTKAIQFLSEVKSEVKLVTEEKGDTEGE